MEWTKVKQNNIPFIDKGKWYETLQGDIINWSSRDAVQAQTWLKKNKMKTNKVGLIDPSQKLDISFGVDNYNLRELLHAEEDHDWTFPIGLKVKGIQHESKWISLNKKEFQKLIQLFS